MNRPDAAIKVQSRSRALPGDRLSERGGQEVDRDPDEAADQRAVDPDELQVAPDRVLDPVGDRARVPPAHGFRNELHDLPAVPGRDPDGGAPREAVDLE